MAPLQPSILKNPFNVEWPYSKKEAILKFFDILTEILPALKRSSERPPRRRSKAKRGSKVDVNKTDEKLVENRENSEKFVKNGENSEKSTENHEKLDFGHIIDETRATAAATSVCSTEGLSDVKNDENAESSSKNEKTSENSDTLRLKNRFVFGTASVLRALTRKQLEFAVFDRTLMKNHAISYQIGQLALNSAGSHCVCVENLSEKLAPILNIKSVISLGSKKSSSTISSNNKSTIDNDDQKLVELFSVIRNDLKCVAEISTADNHVISSRKRKRRKSNDTVDTLNKTQDIVESTDNVDKDKSIISDDKRSIFVSPCVITPTAAPKSAKKLKKRKKRPKYDTK